MIFILDGYQYRYGMDVSRESVHGEWLYRKACRKRAKEVELFYREGEEMKVHTSFSIATDLVNRKMIRNNALLLSAAASLTTLLQFRLSTGLGKQPSLHALTKKGCGIWP